MEYQNIDKEIYHCSEIKRRLRPQYWALISILLGVLGAVLLLFNLLTTMSIVFIVWGGFALLVMILYVLFGDSRAPYHKPTKHLLTREYFYYPTSALNQLTMALEANDEAKLASIKRSASPQLVLVRYSDNNDEVLYSQIKQTEGQFEKPITNIFTNQK